MNKRILYKLTTRVRPEQAYKVIRSIIDLQDNKYDFQILVSVDEDDVTRDILFDKITWVFPNNNLVFITGKSAGKIGSINRDVDKALPWDILVNVSDDTVFIKQGFDTIIRDQFKDFYGVLHTPDGNRSDLMTMSILSKSYYDLDGYIYHPSYVSLWADDESQAVAKLRGKYKFLDVQLFEHRHWSYGKGLSDHQYYTQGQYFQQDKENYERRKAINFNL